MNKSQIEKLIGSKLNRQEMVTSARQEEEKKLAKQMKEKDQAEERQKRANSRAPRSKPQESIRVDRANMQGDTDYQISPVSEVDEEDGSEDPEYVCHSREGGIRRPKNSD
ncbi:uncharacterized protein MELLADRAFT_105079 [Melampsora larici-populina 98AG31]|uniref:Uncharacterized protein n=1 Tax=Melampsora larici-populina (strain 98AG31 / pathotype 3-4-7) TaxID=747676 RepID=F4RH67_MELLP|nr:uncharacterized protein MELLADRAFT_105079 [Melampsora larici-populina 98AG31]EGG08383.1 hypothetical protein MELLADRAFT_105079 [Melampsora larici-populina 98AG31]